MRRSRGCTELEDGARGATGAGALAWIYFFADGMVNFTAG